MKPRKMRLVLPSRRQTVKPRKMHWTLPPRRKSVTPRKSASPDVRSIVRGKEPRVGFGHRAELRDAYDKLAAASDMRQRVAKTHLGRGGKVSRQRRGRG